MGATFTYLEMVNRICDELDYTRLIDNGLGTSIASNVDSKIRQVANNINRAYRHLRIKTGALNENAEISTTFNTVINQENYSFPAGIEVLTQIRVNTDPPIRIIPWHEYERSYRGSLNFIYNFTGSPYVASIYQKQIWFYPVPSSVVTINVRGRTQISELVADTDIPSFAVAGQHAVFELALYFLMLYEGNPATSGQQEIAMEALNDLKSLNRAHEDIPPAMISEDQIAEQDAFRRYFLNLTDPP